MSIHKKDILLIFDLNKVLVIRKPMSSQYVLRPFVKEFLKYMSARFKIAIWTSAKKSNVLDIVDSLFLAARIPLEFEWYQGRCTKVFNKSIKSVNENGQDRPVLVKKLASVWKEFHNFHKGNTILIDDSIAKCSFNPSFTSIHPSEYKLDLNMNSHIIQFHSSQYIHCCCPGLISNSESIEIGLDSDKEIDYGYESDACSAHSADSTYSDELEIDRPTKKYKKENRMDSKSADDNILQPSFGSLWKYLNDMYETIESTDTCAYIEAQPYVCE